MFSGFTRSQWPLTSKGMKLTEYLNSNSNSNSNNNNNNNNNNNILTTLKLGTKLDNWT